MNVLLVNSRPAFLKEWGGDTTQIVETKKALRSLGVLADLAEEDEISDWAKYDLVHIFNMQTVETALRAFERAKAIRKPVVLSTIYWDLSLARNSDNLKFGENRFLARLASTFPRSAMLLQSLRKTRHRTQIYNAQRRLLSAVDLILPNSVAELEIMVADFRLPCLRGVAVVVPNAVCPAESADCAPSELLAGVPEKYVLMAASLHPIKGQARLIEALMEHGQIPLIFAGRGGDTPYGCHCRSLGARRGNTFFIDALPHNAMPQLYRRAKVHALPSVRESPGLSSLEAAVHGANCVVAIYGPVQEYFGLDAFVCDPLDPPSLREAVLQAWNAPFNPNLRNRILKDFTWQRAAEETLRGYEWVLRKASAQRVAFSRSRLDVSRATVPV